MTIQLRLIVKKNHENLCRESGYLWILLQNQMKFSFEIRVIDANTFVDTAKNGSIFIRKLNSTCDELNSSVKLFSMTMDRMTCPSCQSNVLLKN